LGSGAFEDLRDSVVHVTVVLLQFEQDILLAHSQRKVLDCG
jgi:hypothetical protein